MLELEKNLVSYMSSCDENSPKRSPKTAEIEVSKLKHTTDKLSNNVEIPTNF